MKIFTSLNQLDSIGKTDNYVEKCKTKNGKIDENSKIMI